MKRPARARLVALRMRLDVRGQTETVRARCAALHSVPVSRSEARLRARRLDGIHFYLAAASVRARGGGGWCGRRLGGPLGLRQRRDSSFERPSFTCRAVTINGGRKRRTWSCVQLMSRPCFERFGNVGRALDGQIHAEHQPFAANFADEIKFRGQFLQARAQFRAALAHICQQCFVSTRVQERQRRGARQRPAAKCRAVQARAKTPRQIPHCARNAPSGSPPASGFATTTMSGSPVSAGRQMRARCGPGRTEFRRRSAPRRVAWPVRARASRKSSLDGINSAFTLHRLDDHRANVVRRTSLRDPRRR